MPRPVESNSRYVAGLDGFRAIAALAVIAFHLNVGWAKGGLLGVGVFYAVRLSDYLPAARRTGAGTATSGSAFWIRRARRLLPACSSSDRGQRLGGAVGRLPGARGAAAGRLGQPRLPSRRRSPPTVPTSPASLRRCRSTTCGRCRSRSSFISCGGGCFFRMLHLFRRRGTRAVRLAGAGSAWLISHSSTPASIRPGSTR